MQDASGQSGADGGLAGAAPACSAALSVSPAAGLRYLAPFSLLQEWLNQSTAAGGPRLEMSYEDFLDILRHILAAVTVDEAWYRAAYPGVATRIDAGIYQSAAHHFTMHGYFEERLPYNPDTTTQDLPTAFSTIRAALRVIPVRGGLRLRIERAALLDHIRRLLSAVAVDEPWYCATYPGVADAIAEGAFASATQHFLEHGYAECRWPFDMPVDADWYLARYPDARQEIECGRYTSAGDHFWQQGYMQGRLPGKFWFTVLWDREHVLVA